MSEATVNRDALLARLENMDSLDMLFRAFQTPTERELLKRTAIARWFDRDLYENVLCEGLKNPPGFDEYVASNEIDLIPRSNGLYRLTDTTFATYLDAWREDDRHGDPPPSMQTFATRLLQRFDPGEAPLDALAARFTEGDDTALNVLAQLVLVNRDRAMALFEKAFEAAEARFDLVCCDSLLRLLDERSGYLGLDLAVVRDRGRQQYRARCLFAAEFYRTVNYYERPALEDRFRTLVRDGKCWILHLHATGGSGKARFFNVASRAGSSAIE
jgi:hypothetical protein